MLIVTNPVNSTVPIARKGFQAAGCYDARRLFGVTTLDVCRANTFVAEKMDVPPENVSVPVVGGHAGATILPLLSQCSHDVVTKLGDEKSLTELTTRIQVRRQGSSSAFPALHFALCMRCVLHALLRMHTSFLSMPALITCLHTDACSCVCQLWLLKARTGRTASLPPGCRWAQ